MGYRAYSCYADETAEADDSLANLTLLDANTNRSYGNSPFDQKRRIIMRLMQKGNLYLFVRVMCF